MLLQETHPESGPICGPFNWDVCTGLWFMVYGMFVCFGFPLSGRAVRRFGSRPSSPVTAFAGLLHGPQVSQLATVERRGAAARALPPTIPAVLFLGRNVLPSCQHRSQRNTAKGPLRREAGRLSRQAPTIPGIRLHP